MLNLPMPSASDESEMPNVDYGELPTLLSSAIHDTSSIQKWFVYWFHHIDFLGGMFDAKEVLANVKEGFELLQAVAAHFGRAGWEGDGKIQILWLPPFVFDDSDTWGVICFHVKQGNNGTSWITSPTSLKFPDLEQMYPRTKSNVNF